MRRVASVMHTDVARSVYLRNRRPGEAERHLIRALDLAPADQYCRRTLLDFYVQRKRLAEAYKEKEKADVARR